MASFDTLGDLKSTVADWIDRAGDTNITGRTIDFIRLAEARLNRILPLKATETDQTLTAVVNSRVLTPTSFREPISLYRTTGGLVYDEMEPFIVGAADLDINPSIPTQWGVDAAATIVLNCPCVQADTFIFRSRGSLSLAVVNNVAATNWLLTNHPDVYLYASLTQATAFMKNLGFASTWKGALEEAIVEVRNEDSRGDALVELHVDEALQTNAGAYNINTDQ